MSEHDIQLEAEAHVVVRWQGQEFTWDGPILEVAQYRDPIETGMWPWIEYEPGPFLKLGLTFEAGKMEQTQRVIDT